MYSKISKERMLLQKILRVFFVVTLFSVILFIKNVNAAYFKYKDFDAEQFYKDNEKKYENIYGKTKDDPKMKSYLADQLKFYTKLYHELALYESHNFFIDDNIIISTYNSGTSATAVSKDKEYVLQTPFSVDTSAVNYIDGREDEDKDLSKETWCLDDNYKTSGNRADDEDIEAKYDCDIPDEDVPDEVKNKEPNPIEELIQRLFNFAQMIFAIAVDKYDEGYLFERLGTKVSEDSPPIYDTIEQNDFRKDEETAIPNYYSKDFDTIIMLIRNMLAYKTTCYLIRTKVSECPNPDDPNGEPIECCENEEDVIMDVPRGDGKSITRFLTPKRRCGQKFEAIMPHFKYYVSKKENGENRSYLVKNKETGEFELPDPKKELYLYERYIDNYYESCLSAFEEDDFIAMKYVYNGEKEVKTDYYFDFLVSTRYFDQKAQFNSDFIDILEAADVDCLSSDVCKNSLERKGLYNEFKHEIIMARYYIVKRLLSMLDGYGLHIVYHPDPLLGIIDEEDMEFCYGFLWPTGSAETTERNGKTFADGVPPVFSRISSPFGHRNRPNENASADHKGIDIATPVGTNVIASKAGTVSFAGWINNGGWTVYIDHPDGYQTRYMHIGLGREKNDSDAQNTILVSVGDYVEAGEVIALSGDSGNSTGPHLHFEVRVNDEAQDPLSYVSPNDPRQSCNSTDLSGTASCGESGNISPNINQGENAKQDLCLALKEAGYNSAATAGIMVNIQHESHFYTCAYNDGVNADPPGAFGIAQWTRNRQRNLRNLQNYWTAAAQIQYLLTELNGSYSSVSNYIKGVSNDYIGAKKAAYEVCFSFEVPNVDPEERKQTCEGRGSSQMTQQFFEYAENGCN